jgi:hypothetical protein
VLRATSLYMKPSRRVKPQARDPTKMLTYAGRRGSRLTPRSLTRPNLAGGGVGGGEGKPAPDRHASDARPRGQGPGPASERPASPGRRTPWVHPPLAVCRDRRGARRVRATERAEYRPRSGAKSKATLWKRGCHAKMEVCERNHSQAEMVRRWGARVPGFRFRPDRLQALFAPTAPGPRPLPLVGSKVEPGDSVQRLGGFPVGSCG